MENFVAELKRDFTSSFHEELAFQRLENYSRTDQQSIRNFFNEILKVCSEADSTMSESAKLKHFWNKPKTSIQFEVRQQNPTSTDEFLE